MQHFQELLMQKPWLKITSNSLELVFLALKSQNFQTTHHNLPKKSISLDLKKKSAHSSTLILLAHFKGRVNSFNIHSSFQPYDNHIKKNHLKKYII